MAAQVPVVTGEFDENACPISDDGWDDSYMSWADAHGVSYLAWGWYLLSPPTCTQSEQDDSDYYLPADASGTPAPPNGTALHDHLLAP